MTKKWFACAVSFFLDPEALTLLVPERFAWLALLAECKRNDWPGHFPKALSEPILQVATGLTPAKQRALWKKLSTPPFDWLHEDETTWVIETWDKYQRNSTSAMRMRRMRERDRAEVAARAESDVTCDKPARHRDAGTQTETSPPLPPEGEPGADAKRPVRERDRDRLERVMRYVARCGTAPERTEALDTLRGSRPPGDDEVRRLLRKYKWVTSDRLARFAKGG